MPPTAIPGASHIKTGLAGENLAEQYFTRHGYKILGNNWRYGHLELDLICKKNDLIVFVEVKTRSSKKFGGPCAAITRQKIKRLYKAAMAWLQAHDLWDNPCRFDVICLIKNDGQYTLEHYYNAFASPLSLDCGHADWQSW